MARSREEMLKDLERLETEMDADIEKRKKREAETAEIVKGFQDREQGVNEAEQRASEEIADATEEFVKGTEQLERETE